MGAHPLQHPLDVPGVVAPVVHAPLRVGHRLVVLLGEPHLRQQPVGLVDVGVEVGGPVRVVGRHVVAVHADHVGDVVTRVAVRPGVGVRAPGRRELEAQVLAGDRAHRGDDASPVRLPAVRVGTAAAGVGGAVHLPAHGEHRVRQAQGHQPPGQGGEVAVEVTGRALPQLRPDVVVVHIALVVREHRHPDDDQPVRSRRPPGGPAAEAGRVAVDVVPVVPGQIGVADLDLSAVQPLRHLLLRTVRLVRAEEQAEGHVVQRHRGVVHAAVLAGGLLRRHHAGQPGQGEAGAQRGQPGQHHPPTPHQPSIVRAAPICR